MSEPPGDPVTPLSECPLPSAVLAQGTASRPSPCDALSSVCSCVHVACAETSPSRRRQESRTLRTHDPRRTGSTPVRFSNPDLAPLPPALLWHPQVTMSTPGVTISPSAVRLPLSRTSRNSLLTPLVHRPADAGFTPLHLDRIRTATIYSIAAPPQATAAAARIAGPRRAAHGASTPVFRHSRLLTPELT